MRLTSALKCLNNKYLYPKHTHTQRWIFNMYFIIKFMAFLEHKKLFEASRTFIDVLYIYTAIILHIIQRCCKPENCIKNYKTVYDMCYEHFFGYKYIYTYIYINYCVDVIRWFNACLLMVSTMSLAIQTFIVLATPNEIFSSKISIHVCAVTYQISVAPCTYMKIYIKTVSNFKTTCFRNHKSLHFRRYIFDYIIYVFR